MIKINGKEYKTQAPRKELKQILMNIDRSTIIEAIEITVHSTIKETSYSLLGLVEEEFKINFDEKTKLLALAFSKGTPEEDLVFICDVLEAFNGIAPFHKVLSRLYTNGEFYTEDSLKERVLWLRKNSAKLKYPELVDFILI